LNELATAMNQISKTETDKETHLKKLKIKNIIVITGFENILIA